MSHLGTLALLSVGAYAVAGFRWVVRTTLGGINFILRRFSR